EPLLNYRVRPGSGYRRSIEGATYQARLEHFYAKHRDAVQLHGLALIAAKEAFFVGQRDYRKELESRAAALETELAALSVRIASNTYDCIVLTQTLQLIENVDAAIAECARILRPGGVLLATVPCIIRVDDEGGPDGDFWRFTEALARKLFSKTFPAEAFDVSV